MIYTTNYKISILLDDNYFRKYAIVYSAFTGNKLGTVPYNKVLEDINDIDAIDDYINSNMKFK